MSSSKKTPAIGFILRGADRVAFRDHHMNAPDLFIFSRTFASMREQGVLSRDEFGLDEKITESRVGGVGLRRRQDDFGIAGQLDIASPG